MYVTESGISIDSTVIPLNAYLPIYVTELGIMIDCNASHHEYLQVVVSQAVLIKTVERWLCGFFRW